MSEGEKRPATKEQDPQQLQLPLLVRPSRKPANKRPGADRHANEEQEIREDR